jgi:heptosyltransferase II
MRTVVIHAALPGELILLTPLLDSLREDPDLEWLGLVTTPEAAVLFRDDPRISELLVYDKRGRDRGAAGLLRLIRRLRALDVERAVSPHRSLRSSVLAWFSRAFERVGFASATGALAYTELVHDDRDLHEIDRNLALIDRLPEPTAAPLLPTLHDDPAEEARARELFESRGLQLPVALAPASDWLTKRWPPSHWAELAARIVAETPADVVLLGGARDRELIEVITAAVDTRHRDRVHNLAGELGLRESYQALRLCRLAVVNDNAPLHLAQAARISTFAIFGSTVPEFGYGPRGPGDRVFRVDLECSPCGGHGRRSCPLGTLACLEQIGADEVFAAVLERLEAARQAEGARLRRLPIEGAD